MKTLESVEGKDVVDGAGEKMGVAGGIDVDLGDYDLFLRVTGDKIKSVRGRETEFLELKEIDYIDDVIHLYKDLASLEPEIVKTHMAEEKTYRSSEFIGKDITSSDSMVFGKITDVVFSEDFNEAFLVVEGPKVKEIRGNDREVLSLLMFIDVDKTVHLIHDYETISGRLQEKADKR